MADFTFPNVSGAETRDDDPTSTSPGLVVRPINSAAAPIFVEPVPATTSTVAAVAVNAVAVTLLAANANRLGFSVRNTSTADTLFILSSPAGVPSATLHTVALAPGAYYEDPNHYVGRVEGVWNAATNGNAMVTEYTP